jgi:hypothetical protein
MGISLDDMVVWDPDEIFGVVSILSRCSARR